MRMVVVLILVAMFSSCGISGLNPFGGNPTEIGGVGSLNLAINGGLIGRDGFGTNELPVVLATLRLSNTEIGVNYVKNHFWASNFTTNFIYNDVPRGHYELKLFSRDSASNEIINSILLQIRTGFNYSISVWVGCNIFVDVITNQ